MPFSKGCIPAAAAGLLAALLPFGALAEQPVPWEMGMQPAATPVMRDITEFHNLLLVVIFLVALFVLALLIYVVWRFSESRNPTPSRTTHNTLVEVLWTVIPVVILVVIAVPSFKLLYYEDTVPEADMTVKVVGHQWYWTYAYPDNGNFSFDSIIIPTEDLKPGQPRLLSVDNHVVVPLNTNVRIQVTADDVLHSWAMPAFGVKIDAVPGRLNEKWFRAERIGTYYGQCSELCGVNHGFMPIRVDVVSQEDFKAWLAKAQKQFARGGESAPDARDDSQRELVANAASAR